MINSRPLIRAMSRLHILSYQLSGGALGGRVSGAPVLLLTTRGGRTGLTRTTPLLFLQEGGDMVVVASNAGDDAPPGWFLNLMKHPEAEVQVGRRVMPVTARQATEAERAVLWPKLTRMYPDYARYETRTRRKIALVWLTRRADSTLGGQRTGR